MRDPYSDRDILAAARAMARAIDDLRCHALELGRAPSMPIGHGARFFEAAEHLEHALVRIVVLKVKLEGINP